jgi:hypothetical protein
MTRGKTLRIWKSIVQTPDRGREICGMINQERREERLEISLILCWREKENKSDVVSMWAVFK